MNKKYYLVLVISLATAALLAGFFLLNKKLSPETADNTEISLPVVEERPEPEATIEENEAIPTQSQSAEQPAPKSFSLDVAFISQAPYAVWDALHEDACEEASLIMIRYYQNNIKSISKETAEKEIQDMIKYESSANFDPSITLSELNAVAANYYKLNHGRIVRNPTVDQIKAEILAGRPVMIPAAGKILPNPNFRNGGPNYHMLVIKGYNETGFITNDPGTRKGNNFWYSYDDLMNAIRDWNPDDILTGQRAYLVFD